MNVSSIVDVRRKAGAKFTRDNRKRPYARDWHDDNIEEKILKLQWRISWDVYVFGDVSYE